MSLPKTGLRKISVAETAFVWTIRKRPTSKTPYYRKKLIAAIQLVTDSPRGLLLVDFGVSPPGIAANPHKTSVTPKTIELAVKMALEKGWDPAKPLTVEMDYPLTFVPDPNSKFEESKYDVRWDY